MLSRATVFQLPVQLQNDIGSVDQIVEDLLGSHTKGWLMLPDGEEDPESYCKGFNSISAKNFAWIHTDIVRLSENNQIKQKKDECCYVIAYEVKEGIPEYLKSCLEENLVTPSVLRLNGCTVKVNKYLRDRIWRMHKIQGRLGRAGGEEGIVQWGHLMNELAFCFGINPKYGD